MDSEKKKWVAALESIRWGGIPKCPYCGGVSSATAIEGGLRHHCNECYTSFSVTVGTLFHHSHIELQKWFIAIALIQNSSKPLTVRQLAQEIGVTKNTAAKLIRCIKNAKNEDLDLIQAIAAYQTKG